MRHTLLEHDERTGWALVYTCPEAVQRYCVCYRYDKQAGDWAQGHYTDDLLDAVEMYRAEIGRPIGATAIRSILADAERALRPLVAFVQHGHHRHAALAEPVEPRPLRPQPVRQDEQELSLFPAACET